MAQIKEDPIPPAEEGPCRARPGPEDTPEDTRKEDEESIVYENVPQGSAASHLASGQAGIIESIQLENFMGQAMLGPVQFGSGVNFVVGQEGQKELVMSLLLALRRKSLRPPWIKYVKLGDDLATISITLRNGGKAAFKADLYGKSIRVELSLSVRGTASYTFKDQAGRVISSEKEELTAILDHFKIQVDNSVSVLQQEIGGRLLHTTNDGDRYKFLLKVTQLEQINNDYLSLLEKKTWTQKRLDKAEGQLHELKQRGMEIKGYFHSMTSSEKRVQELKFELAWALVNESERQIEVMMRNVTLGHQTTATLNQKLETCQVTFTEASTKFDDLQEKLQQLTKEAAELETTCIQAEKDVNRKEMVYKNAEILYHSSQYEFKVLD